MSMFLRIFIVATVTLSLQLAGCVKPSCQTSTSACGTFETCCTPTDCYYKYKNKKYNCDGTDCEGAAEKLAADMCGTAKKLANGPLSETEQEALNKVKMLIENNSSCVTCP